MELREVITVDSSYTRSINLERDRDTEKLTKSYVVTSRSVDLLNRFHQATSFTDMPRAWSLIGPYGSGKSSFSLFLASLLSKKGQKLQQAAQKTLKSTEPQLANDYDGALTDDGEYARILITGSPESLKLRVYQGIYAAFLEYFPDYALKSSADNIQPSNKDVLALLSEFQQVAKKTGTVDGVLLVIDELGKFLEYEARHYGANEIYLLQELAEKAYTGSEVNLYVFVLLHQSFEQYARGLSDAFKNEWSKVQGRYEEVAFLEGTEQTLRVVSKAIKHKAPDEQKKQINGDIANVVKTLIAEGALPTSLGTAGAQSLFEACYPLHPVTALLLPSLCHKFAQNERTLFSFLSSKEEFGLQSELKRRSVGEFIKPDVVFDYFVANQSSAINDQLTSRRWAEVLEGIERLGDSDESERLLVKTIGLFNILGSRSGLKSSTAILNSVLDQSAKTLDKLREKSIVTYRKFSDEYRVWQGSDFDLQEELIEQRAKLGKFSVPEYLNESELLGPIVARKYTVESGALRYFLPTFIEYSELKREKERHEQKTPNIVFVLNATNESFKPPKEKTNVWVLVRDSEKLNECVREYVALQRIERENQQLNNDPIALRELKEYLKVSRQTLLTVVENLVASPSFSTWFFAGTEKMLHSRRELQEFLSDVLTSAFSKSPIINNELLNRDKLSSQAAAGRNKLLFALANNSGKEDLGIEKFPPEKSMYRSVLLENKIHQRIDDEWKLTAPSKKSTLWPAWHRIESFLEGATQKPKDVTHLYDELSSPPYGLKLGFIPLLFLTVFFYKQKEVAVYEEQVFIPQLTDDAIERFLRVPHLFAFQSFKLEGINQSVFETYQSSLFKDSRKRSVVEIAKPLAKFIGDLPGYTKKTRGSEISERAIKVLKAFDSARSPHKLLFDDLPKALGFSSGELNDRDSETFVSELMKVLRELKYVYPEMLERQRELICEVLHVSNIKELSELRKLLRARFSDLINYSVDVDGVKAFLNRLTGTVDDDETWFIKLLMFLSSKPPKDWTDSDASKAQYNLLSYGKKIAELEKLRLEYDQVGSGGDSDIDVVLLRVLRRDRETIEKPIIVDREKLKRIEQVKESIGKLLDSEKEDDDILTAALVGLLEDKV